MSSKQLVASRNHGRPRASRDADRRKWGQNFFRSAASARRFSGQLEDSRSASGSRREGALVVEIGAGGGRITRELASAGHEVLAVEIDAHWAHRLTAEELPGVTVANEDFLDLRLPRGPVRFVGNLPFVSGTRILRRCLDLGPGCAAQGVFLLQQEYVGKRTGAWGGNLFNAQWEPWYDFAEGLPFNRREFSPVPQTDTSTLLVTPHHRPVVPWQDRVDYQEFVDLMFNTGQMTIGDAARKVLRRGHAQYVRAAGIRPAERVKDLDARQWAELFRLRQEWTDR